MKDITSTITKPLAVLGENGKGYTKEANFISWNGNAAKLDIRGIRTTNAAARVSHSRRTRAEIFTQHSRQSMKRNNPFSAGNGAFGNGRPYFYGGR